MSEPEDFEAELDRYLRAPPPFTAPVGPRFRPDDADRELAQIMRMSQIPVARPRLDDELARIMATSQIPVARPRLDDELARIMAMSQAARTAPAAERPAPAGPSRPPRDAAEQSPLPSENTSEEEVKGVPGEDPDGFVKGDYELEYVDNLDYNVTFFKREAEAAKVAVQKSQRTPARNAAWSRYYKYRPLQYYRRRQELEQTLAQIDLDLQRIPEGSALYISKTTDRLYVEENRAINSKNLKAVTTEKRKFDAKLARLRREFEAKAAKKTLPPLPFDARVAFDASWFQDKRQLEWNSIAAQHYFRLKRDEYLDSVNEGDQLVRQMLLQIKVLQAGALTLRAVLREADAEATAGDISEFKDLTTQILRQLDRLPADYLVPETAPKDDELDWHWYSQKELTQLSPRQADELKQRIFGEIKSLQETKSKDQDIEQQILLADAKLRYDIYRALHWYLLRNARQRLGEAGEAKLRQAENELKKANLDLSAQVRSRLKVHPDLEKVKTELKNLVEPGSKALAVAVVHAEKKRGKSSLDFYGPAKKLRDELTVARRALTLSPGDAKILRERIKSLIHEIGIMVGVSADQAWTQTREFSGFLPGAATELDVMRRDIVKEAIATDPVPREEWVKPKGFTDKEWKRGIDVDEIALRVSLACVRVC